MADDPSENLIDYIKNSHNIENADYVTQEFLDLMKKNKCDLCNKNRIDCSFNPWCPNRMYLSIMIDLDLKKDYLPDFCYSQHLWNLTNYLQGKVYNIEPIDIKLFLEDFIQILEINLNIEPSMYNKICNEIVKKMAKNKGKVNSIPRTEGNKDYFLFIADGVIYQIDLKRLIVTVNLQNKIVQTEQELVDIINLFGQYYGLKVEIIEELMGWWYLKIFIPVKKLKNLDILQEYSEKLQEFSEYVYYYLKDSIASFVIDIKTPLNKNWRNLKFSVSKLSSIFEIIVEFTKKIPK